MFRSKSIRFKLLILILAILIPLVIIRVINIVDNFKNKVENNLNSYENLANAISTAFNNYLEEIWIIEDIVGTYITDHPNLSDDDLFQYLKLVQEKERGLIRIHWLDTEGNVITSSDKRLMNMSLGERTHIQDIKNGKNKVVSDLITSVLGPYSCIIPVARAIYSDGKPVGIIVAVIDPNHLNERLPEFKIDQNNRYLLIDSKGMLVYCSDGKKRPDDKISYKDNPSVMQALEGKLTANIKQMSKIDESYVMSVDYPIPGIGWDCRVTAPYDKAVSSAYLELLGEIAVLFFSVSISLIIALVFGRILLKPVSILRLAAKKIMDGDYSARTNLKGHDEIGMAAEAFDRMAESIEQWHSIKTQFFTNISHELKTPLNVIFSSIQLIDNYKASLDRETYRTKVSKQMKIIRQNCYRIMRIINNLIDISRHDSGFLKIKLNDYDMVKLIRDITLSVQRYVEAKGIELCFITEMETQKMACDPDMIERIMLNLISNAIKFTDKNGNITVSLKEKDNNLIIAVSDTGVGIPEDKLGIIFERFGQADDPYMRNKEGSGIGLSLVKAFVEAHGGTVSVTSELSKGTTFYVRIPIRVLSSPIPILKDELYAQDKQNTSNVINKVNIEFSDIYSCYDGEIS